MKIFEAFKLINEDLFDKHKGEVIKHKNKVIIPLDVNVSDYNLDDAKIPKLSVGVGIQAATELKINYRHFDFSIVNGKLAVVFSTDGKRMIKVRSQKDPNYLENFLTSLTKITKEYLK